ncbi:prolyl oligopeptidase family serine peptidase [Brevundimonas lenta]|uniref:Prolyl oligopeptidase n=1 Tax=Brevundimonas lenta TaxID=424796 RepID=A0A7W6JAJ9_9CAUL|nr:prolyl oligopeptidase family serine peptidase [Brevundimonas lenta]MBB4081578.1 prolyl oligopeptidase [Brevundimonas lenta]
MNRLLLSAAVPALLLAAPAMAQTGDPMDQAHYASPRANDLLSLRPIAIEPAPAPHLPTDLSPAGVRAADDHLALEEVNGTEAMAFVASENEKSLATLTGDRRYEPFRQQAEAILTATDRIPSPSFLGDGIGNFWQDAANPKGVWRRTTLQSYRSADTQWETLLDIDALSRAEGKDWVFKGADCLAPDETRCLINLSDGGKDAVVVREFDLTTKAFVDGGFILPEGKHRIEWLDRDTLLVATDFGAGTLTESGYPFIVKSLKRGQTLAQATEVYRGDISDGGYGVSPSVLRNDAGQTVAILINRPLDTFRSETWQLHDERPVKLNLPERVGVRGAMAGQGPDGIVQLVFTLDEPWAYRGRDYATGSLMSVSLATLRPADADEIIVSNAAIQVFAPTARQSIEDVAVFDDRIVAGILDNVRGRAVKFEDRGEWGWPETALPVPENTTIHLGSTSRSDGRFFYSVEGFLTPQTLSLGDAAAATGETLRQAPARFDASTHKVEQFEATSSDGTKIPYFVVMPKDLVLDGHAPTILFGYGGFQVSKPPAYIPEMGKLWLENGGVFVNANIRGGGEFGPEWHQAVLKENRQLAFDDFAAVAADLHARGISSPRRTGIYGRSNGGVLTSVSITQHPELFNAAVIESPLIDMLRYYELPAGASWIGEYGDPRIPEEAAYIARYSGYQQLRPGAEYPRVYITTNTRDDRVHPGHARKFAARLGDMGYDHIYYEETAGGHSNDADPVANARRWARHYVYLAQQLMD